MTALAADFLIAVFVAAMSAAATGPVPAQEGRPVMSTVTCWADPLSRRERRELAARLARSCKRSYVASRFVVDREPQLADFAMMKALTIISAEAAELHLDVTERAEVPAPRGHEHERTVNCDEGQHRMCDGYIAPKVYAGQYPCICRCHDRDNPRDLQRAMNSADSA